MHARINYVDIKPESFQEVDDFWRTVVEQYAGLVRGCFLRDGDTPHTLSVVVFETEEQMKANTERQLGEVVKRAAAHRLSEPILHHLEAVAHIDFSAKTANCARVLDVTIKPERLEEVIAGWAPAVSTYAGVVGGYMLSDRASGKTKSVSFWRSREEMLANESGGALAQAVEPYREMLAVEPVRSYWDVRVVV